MTFLDQSNWFIFLSQPDFCLHHLKANQSLVLPRLGIFQIRASVSKNLLSCADILQNFMPAHPLLYIVGLVVV